jgi:chemotaxis signal transduction protein
MSFESTKTNSFVADWRRGDIANRADANRVVDVVVVIVGHQPFGLLVSQVYNIVRSATENLNVLREPDPKNGRQWGEIAYSGGTLRVMELARMLQLSLVEPLSRSKVLLSGKLLPNGNIEQPFGVAVDDILAVRTVNLEDLRVLPDWLCRKRLGRLLWGAALIDKTELVQQSIVNEFNSANVLSPVQFSDFLSEAMSFGSNGAVAPISLPQAQPLRSFVATDTNRTTEEVRRPVMLMDLDVLKEIAYRS